MNIFPVRMPGNGSTACLGRVARVEVGGGMYAVVTPVERYHSLADRAFLYGVAS